MIWWIHVCLHCKCTSLIIARHISYVKLVRGRHEKGRYVFLKKNKKTPTTNSNQPTNHNKTPLKQKWKTTTSDTQCVSALLQCHLGKECENKRAQGILLFAQNHWIFSSFLGCCPGWPWILCMTKRVVCHNKWNEKEIELLSLKMGAGTLSWSKLYKVIESHWLRPKTSPADLL